MIKGTPYRPSDLDAVGRLLRAVADGQTMAPRDLWIDRTWVRTGDPVVVDHARLAATLDAYDLLATVVLAALGDRCGVRGDSVLCSASQCFCGRGEKLPSLVAELAQDRARLDLMERLGVESIRFRNGDECQVHDGRVRSALDYHRDQIAEEVQA